MAQASDSQTFIDGVLQRIGAPVDATTTAAFTMWLEKEQGQGLTAFEQNKGNPLGIQSQAAQAAGQSGNLQQGIELTAQELMQNYGNIVQAFKTAKSPEEIATQIVNSPWNNGKSDGTGYGGVQSFMSGGTSVTSTPGTATLPQSTFLPPEPGVNPASFHGYDLSAVPQNELGNAENAVQKYVTDPGFKQQLDQRISADFGYQVGFAQKVPQLYGVLIWASSGAIDPSTAAGKNLFETAVSNTTWWKTTNANQRAWAQIQGTDPAQASQALSDAQEKVLADANQMGVTLTKNDLNKIANIYAANTFVQSGSLGSQSGTAAEWLDQAITDTIMNVQGQKVGKLPTDLSSLPTGQSTFDQLTQGETSGTGLFGISAQLYADAQNIAQQYLMYNPTNPTGSLVDNKFLIQQVQAALQNYTGTGSSFGSTNLINGFQQQFTQTMKQMATNFYPSLGPSIGQGVTPQQYVSPYAQLIGGMMGISPGSIDFTSPQWNWAIATPDPKTGVKTALTLDQVQQKLTTLPQWQQSNTANQMATDVTTQLAKQFGFGGD